ncbi:tumor necrosis factor receptor superfamily member 11B-like [Megalops cyprinoides]|uniref:tumor necrosis factor receptor superfamily member 11B-like n=1 Tax=Megalops cyprinoides TaxID=118141 RepID=UPI0018644AF3|nr:tumor necrosis factor receptor superfamily member 11B-like [Megalops cyprinoides]
MLLFSLLFLLAGHTLAEVVNSKTYQHQDTVTGRVLTCNRCPPGSYRRAHCTADQQTICSPCPPNYFTKYWNYVSKCFYCTVCGDDQVVRTECSAFDNRVCECKEGYYWSSPFCHKHTQCPAGYAVKQKGTALRNTECEKCPHGSYNNNSGQQTCVKHADCASRGLQTVLSGTGWHDTLCASCKELRTGGGIELFRGILPVFFAHERMMPTRLRRFVNLLHLGRRKRLNGSDSWDSLQGYISKWIRDADHGRLKKLPETLRTSGLHNAANKLERKLRRVEDVHLCQNDRDSS